MIVQARIFLFFCMIYKKLDVFFLENWAELLNSIYGNAFSKNYQKVHFLTYAVRLSKGQT